jgi:hypothetical protein
MGADIRYIDAIYCEASFVPLYERQPLINEIVAHLADNGFIVRGVYNQFATKSFGPTQVDVFFERVGE